jgi:hypothetical protein
MADSPHTELSVACGNCGGNVLMAACNHFRGTGHEWVLASICMVCRETHWTAEGCLDCKEQESRESDLRTRNVHIGEQLEAVRELYELRFQSWSSTEEDLWNKVLPPSMPEPASIPAKERQ